jgi:hypothetical protein
MDYYLDNNAVNYLFENSGYSELDLIAIRNRLRTAVTSGTFAVIADIVLLNEIIDAAPSKPAKCRKMRDYVMEIVGPNWLLPLNERVQGEVRLGRPLQGQERMMTRSNVKNLQQSASHLILHEIAEQHFMTKQMLKKEQEAKRERLTSIYGTCDLQLNTKEWWQESQAVIADWVRSYFDKSKVVLGLSDDPLTWPEPKSIPSAWHLHAYKLARL